jgi:hypothetical protein
VGSRAGDGEGLLTGEDDGAAFQQRA